MTALRRVIPALGSVLLLLSTACSGVPRRVIGIDRMAALIADLHTGEAVAEQNRSRFSNDSMRQLLKQSIYAAHGVTPEQVDSSMMWYGRHIDKYIEVYDKAQEILDKKLERANELAATATERPPMVAFEAEGDSVDIWTRFRLRPLSPNMASDRITFEIKSDRFWESGDVYCLRFKGVNTPGRFDVALAMEYSDGATDYVAATQKGGGWHEVWLHVNDTLTATVLFGDIAYSGPDRPVAAANSPQALVDSVSLVRMRRSNGSSKPRSGQRNFGYPRRR